MFLLPADYWKVKKIEKKGRGVFAQKDIQAGVIIGDYLGNIVKDDAEEKENEGFYEMYYTDETSIWPDPRSEGIHLINHSCEPNCFMYSYLGHTLYFALRKIFAGEELTVSYCMAPIDKDCAPCEDICHCGSEFCTGTMHLPAKNYDSWRAFDDAMSKDVIIPPFNYGDPLPKLPSYPKNIEDNVIYPLFGSPLAPAYALSDQKLPSQQKLRKLIRQTGQKLYFENLNLTVIGITDNHLLGKITSIENHV